MLHAEVLPVSGSSLDDLDLARLSDYLINMTDDETAPQSPHDWTQRLSDRMRPFISTEGTEINEGLRREPSYRFPLGAVREALLNALVHRDWTRPNDVEVVNYSDRLEMTSPGTLQNSMTLEKMLAWQRSPRNSIIVEIMRDYGYVDARGMGQFSGKEAIFELTENYLRVVTPARQAT